MLPSIPDRPARLDLSVGSILTVLIGDEPHVLLRPAVEQLGLDWKNQSEKLKTRSWASVVQSTMQAPGDTQARSHTLGTVDTFLMLLATINEHRVTDTARPVLIAFQRETAKAIANYWTAGGAVNPRATEDQLDTLIHRARRQAEVLRVLGGIVDPGWLETKGRMLAARALGEEPEVDPADRPLYVPDYLKSRGLSRKQVEAVQSWFGRRAASIYVATHGERPGRRVTDLPNGSVRETAAWTERDRPVFDETWATFYAEQFPAAPVQGELGGAA